MFDPSTKAFDIRIPIKTKRSPYGIPFITIWHKDPLKFKFPDGTVKNGGSRDDSCGWSSPMYHDQELEAMKKLAKYQYGEIFARQVAEKEGKSYAYVCNQPETTYEVIYWIWRSIKANGKKGWMYGNKRNFLSVAELELIMQLATNPVDNFKHHLITDCEKFVDMFMLIWRQFRAFHRPWYKHPRWHIHHWEIQFHPWQNFYQRHIRKCSKCGRYGSVGWHNTWSGGKKDAWCSHCQGYTHPNAPDLTPKAAE